MPISVAYQRNEYGSLFKGLKTLIERSISFSFTDNARSILRSVSFAGRRGNDSSPKPSQHFERSPIQGFLSFNSRRQMQPCAFETMVSAASPKPEDQPSKSSDEGKVSNSPRLIEADSPKHEAALRLQKVYKSFRTRRQLADCAIIIEQQWWNLVDVALLKRNSVSFFNVDKQETAVSRWSRARRKASQVGKGLSKDAKAQKLALQHWLEAIDPRHRYGHNLNFYYDHWLQCKSKQPFFYWLDVGEGKEINLQEQCNRSKLQQECIMYLGLREREAYQVIVEDGKFMYKDSGEIINTCNSPEDKKWIFVLSTSRNLYIGQKARGRFQHSSFLAGGATSAAGRIVIEHGVLKAVWPHSGHYRPTNTNFQEFMNFLHEKGVDLSNVRTNPSEGDDAVGGLISCPSADFTNYIPQTEEQLPHHAPAEETTTANAAADTELIGTEITADSQQEEATEGSNNAKSIDEEEQEQEQDGEQVLVPSDSLLRRIKSKKEMKTYQLGNSLTFKWAAGTGPRIACVRDYPSELQLRALEQVSLSPRGPCSLPSAILTPRHSRLSSVNEACSSS